MDKAEVSNRSPQALEEDFNIQNPMALALKKKRKLMAAKYAQGESNTDSYGNETNVEATE